ncbi:hypothetical protein EVA_16608 [gut metagenome]|uniref:Poly(3-hydroxybutyrate) depolymerase n=1 Tax=gut metagenome TaxID=749906 RepID=J9G0F1_9ZZZZ
MQLVPLLSSLFHLHFLEMPKSSFMKKKCYLISALSLLLNINMQAQKPAEMEAYFLSTLRGEQVDKVPGKRFSMKHVDERRKEVWQAWKRACAVYDGVQLPPLDSLSKAPRSEWQLPDSLEPQAVMPFYFGAKGVKPEAGYPFFLYLHGSGPKQQEWQTGLVLAQRFADAPSVYFIPQIPNEGGWYRWWQRSKQFAWERLLRQVLLREDINPNRLYVFGISEGGYGSQRLASYYADYWAAAGPMAGGEPLKNAPAENVGNIGFSLRTGAKDYGFYRHILTNYVKQALDSLEVLYPAGFRHRVELIPERGHAIDYAPTTPWLSLFHRNPSPRQFCWEDFEMDGRHRRGFYNILVNERPDPEARTSYTVNIVDNVVHVAVENVRYVTTERDSVYGIEMKFRREYDDAYTGRFTLFLNEDLVDLSRPVTIIVNGRQLYWGMLTANTRNLLRSLAAFYDPQRMYPVAYEVKL